MTDRKVGLKNFRPDRLNVQWHHSFFRMASHRNAIGSMTTNSVNEQV